MQRSIDIQIVKLKSSQNWSHIYFVNYDLNFCSEIVTFENRGGKHGNMQKETVGNRDYLVFKQVYIYCPHKVKDIFYCVQLLHSYSGIYNLEHQWSLDKFIPRGTHGLLGVGGCIVIKRYLVTYGPFLTENILKIALFQTKNLNFPLVSWEMSSVALRAAIQHDKVAFWHRWHK